ncbi:MAG: metallophosphoesterase [Terriglobales bacterium]
MRLRTYVHISDLHIGSIDPETRDARASRLWAKWEHFDGLLGHSYRSLVRLEAFFDRLRNAEDAMLIVSGDLTTVGNPDEFATADAYLGDLLRPPKGMYLGLKYRKWREHRVPGNHDHWPGAPVILGPPTSDFPTRFSGIPDEQILTTAGRNIVRFLRVDTDSDVSPYGAKRVLARGSFVPQLKQLASRLKVPNENEVRILVLHHSYSASGPTLAMDSRSKAALHDFIVEHDIAVLLCGHIHQPPFVQALKAVHLKQTATFLEARCGTTTQVSTLPYEWTTLTGSRPQRPEHWPNTLLVHRLYKDGNRLWWETEVHAERPTGFSLIQDLLPDFPYVARFGLLPRDQRGAI